MPAKSKNKHDNRSDEQSKALDSNPCGICRASGLPVCKGHGKGAGSGEAKNDSFQRENTPTPNDVPANVEPNALSAYLEDSKVWNSDEDFLYTFNHGLAVFSIELDSARGLIHFQGKEFISANDEKDLNALYDKIEEELKTFADEVNALNISFSREGNHLRINISDPNAYDKFVTGLLNKNLIPDNSYHTKLAYKANPDAEQNVVEKEAASYKSPNPFDISGNCS